MRGRAAVFMLHRLADREVGTPGHDPDVLRRMLAYLRRERYEIWDLRHLFHRLAEGAGGGSARMPAVAFTIDEGYVEQAEVGGDIFAAFDCPVTTFVTTAFLDGALWLWWDRIEHIFAHTARRAIDVDLDGARVRYARDAVAGYAEAQADFTERCKGVSERAKLVGIERLAAASEVEVPARPPLRYRPMSWDQVRALESRGMSFGAHTVTHPILSRTSDEQSQHEIVGSWERLRACVRNPVPIFCYPNGTPADYGAREINTVKSLGLAGAVGSTPGYAAAGEFVRDRDAPFRARRFGCPDDLPSLIQCVSGLERLKQILRGVG